MMRLLSILCALLALAQCQDEGGKVVETQQGPVKGYLSQEGNYFQFFGIPYATAPKGKDKFKAPFDPPKWAGVFEATNNRIACPQPAFPGSLIDKATQTEDCLVVNVFVPRTNKTNLSVFVYIHGGAYLSGSANELSHEPLLRHEVVVVNINYRLGVYGFLCLGTKDVPGNAGMKDQVAALRWIKRNIANFGGNPHDVTICGSSAGSSSVEHHMLSKMSRGLFAKVIAESGSAFSPWAMTPDPIVMAQRYMLEISNKFSNNIFEIEEYFKSLTTEQLTAKHYLTEPDANFGFVPCVETRIQGEESFYGESPLDILLSGHYNDVPFMSGFAREEGLFRIDLFDQWAGKMERNFGDFLPQDLTFRDDIERRIVADKVRRFYFKDGTISTGSLNDFVNYVTDTMLGHATVRSAEIYSQFMPVHLYYFSYVSSIQIPHAHADRIKGATHCEQCFLVNTPAIRAVNYSQDDLLIQSRLAKMWTNFAKYGTPVPSTSELLPVAWDPVDPARLNYLQIDLKFEARDHLLGDRYKFWDAIYQQYYREPVCPYDPHLHFFEPHYIKFKVYPSPLEVLPVDSQSAR